MTFHEIALIYFKLQIDLIMLKLVNIKNIFYLNIYDVGVGQLCIYNYK